MSQTSSLKHSPLHQAHLGLAARMVPFAGWEMPVQYSSIVEEHRQVRTKVGVFDISHMGQFLVDGADAEAFLNHALTNDVRKLGDGDGQYTLLLNETGGVIDDLIVYRITAGHYFLVVNASMIDADRDWLSAQIGEQRVVLTDLSAQLGGLAIQGPESATTYASVVPGATEGGMIPRNRILVIGSGAPAENIYICGTGYTGEAGFEFFAPASAIESWFHQFVATAQALGGGPSGLGARDTLRLEMGYPLNGNDLAPDKTPLEAGLGFFVNLEKGDFTGREALVAQKQQGLPCRLAAFRMTGGGPPPRPHYAVLSAGEKVGEINSGGLSPSLAYGIGMAYLPLSCTKPGTPLEIEIRGKHYPAEVVKKPFYHNPEP